MSRHTSRPMPTLAHKASGNSLHLPSPLEALLRLYRLTGIWTRRSQDRLHLKELDDHLLQDLGLSREQVEREISKPFWRG
ncbi:DUF1127 domain-containing protein [Aquibaculum sediminis]|uniref:DUF1127 domain-containing protein n=1 Tax=Aquibaculum sediminis TaxID=3231907 RepID=UPI0034516391